MSSPLVDALDGIEQLHPLVDLVHRYSAVHTLIGNFGNALFFVGSVLFLTGPRTVGVWLFIFGSAGMFVGSLGSAAVQYYYHLHGRPDAAGGSASQASQ